MMSPDRTPVIIGVGQINDRENQLDPIALMAAALETADGDAGGGWINQLDSIAIVNQISFPSLGNCAQALVDRFGITPSHIEQTPHPTGESPVQLLNEAANRIGAGESEVAFIGGAEALRTAAERARASSGVARDPLRDRARPAHPSYAMRYGLVAPTDLYPLYENAIRAAWGQSLDEAQHESGHIWAGMSEVAAANPSAWLRRPLDVEAITTADADNRPIAFPYLKRMVANASVNQGAGFIVTSLARAQAAGIAGDRIIHIGMGAAAHEAHNILARDSLSDPKAMAVTIEETLRRNALAADQIDHVELYSCFPCVPKMARRVFGWPVDKPISAFGGLTFGGGPIGNYMSHAICAMVEKLRAERGTALMFANGGFATHFHGILLAAHALPNAVFPHSFDCNDLAQAKRDAPPEIVEDYEGAATIESYTVFYERGGDFKSGTIVARTTGGARTLAHVPDTNLAVLQFLTNGDVEPIGTAGRIVRGENGLHHWHNA